MSKKDPCRSIYEAFHKSLCTLKINKADIQNYVSEMNLPTIDREIQKKLQAGGFEIEEGISNKDISFSFPDRLLLYKKRPVVAFIKDQFLQEVNYMQKRYSKYHICFCNNLQEKAEKNTLEKRYVITYNTSGIFKINVTIQDEFKQELGYVDELTVPLQVCQDCLRMINWKKFTNYCGRNDEDWYKYGDSRKRNEIVRKFKLEEYFKFAKEQAYLPDNFVPDTSSVYTKKKYRLTSFEKYKIKQAHNFICDYCRKKYPANRLQIHHKNHNEGDNWYSNLVVLCKNCHEEIHDIED